MPGLQLPRINNKNPERRIQPIQLALSLRNHEKWIQKV